MKTVFSVDDSPTARASVEYILSKAGYSVKQADDGSEAINLLKAKQEDVNLFLFDINMPNMNGIELTKEVRKIPKYRFTPILILTTESQESKKLEGKDAGASGWIVKPYEPDKLLSLINKFVGE
ncbi:MAG: response regulator [Spirochaetales bacterium]|nr:response regulator [Spirochaetales bacterium]